MLSEMPQVGYGLWKVPGEDCDRIVRDAIEAGYRHFDSAADYSNEKEVGAALAAAVHGGDIERGDLWITSKLWNTYHHPDHVRPALMRTLEDLRLDYLDLYLIHFPIALAFVPFEERYPPEWIFDPSAQEPAMKLDGTPLHETWAAMEDLVKEGAVKNIGVCNYNAGLLHDLMRYAKISPANLQIESHPYLTQDKLIRLARAYGLGVTAFSPLGALSYVELDMAEATDAVINEPVVLAAAERCARTPAQIVLRWNIQRGVCVIPKTAKAERMRENIALFDFELSDNEMEAISALNKNRRFNDPGDFCEAAFNTFHPIYD